MPSSDQEANTGWNPKYRKRKKYQGSVWVPERNSAVVDIDGAYCHDCRKRHGYMKGLNIGYERRDGVWHILWTCKRTGRLCDDMELRKKDADTESKGSALD